MTSRRRGLVLIQDGLGDWPVPELGDRTPLEAARKPVMDSLITAGAAGLIDIIAPGVKVETDIGHLALFGQDPVGGYSGRGPLEAAGVGLQLQLGDVAFRCNLATMDSSATIVDRRAGRIRDTGTFAAALDGLDLEEGVRIFFRGATDHRAILVLRGAGLSPAVSDSDPGREGHPIRVVGPTDASPEAARTAELVNRFLARSRGILERVPGNEARRAAGLPEVNCVITRGAGRPTSFENIAKKFSIRAACISGESTVRGTAQLCGFETFDDQSMTANIDTNLEGKAALAVRTLETHDLVYVHLKGCDIMAHDRRPLDKMRFIERTDAMVGDLLSRIENRDNLVLAFVSDHCTSSQTGEHTGDPVPVFVQGPGIESDAVARYGERDCARGRLGRMYSVHFLAYFFAKLGVQDRRKQRREPQNRPPQSREQSER
ncbi:MAG: 2,3-bisphosphoglycerate-independent phosphoglycerate mutase [Acidobacteriota bacterium]